MMILLVALSSLFLGAHFLRRGEVGLALGCALLPTLLLSRRRWSSWVLSLYLLAGTLLWLSTIDQLVAERLARGAPWIRMALILGTVALASLVAALLLHTDRSRARFHRGIETATASTAAFLLVAITCGSLQARLHSPVPFLLERWWPGFGWLQVLALATYAAFVAEWLVASRQTARLRRRLWLLFSVVFFSQLLLGLLGFESLLMTGELHLPVPALILAGPLHRGEGLFMLLLFLGTVALVGPAWCSWLCYVGAWDNLAASTRRPLRSPRHPWLRLAILVLVLTSAWGLRQFGVGGVAAALLAALFGLIGVAVMVLASRRSGSMIHCTVVCPVGLVADLLGRAHPLRVEFGEECDGCRACTTACRYAALGTEDILRRQPGITCSLCGDCLSACEKSQLRYGFPALAPSQARCVFLVLERALHAIFLGVARI